MGGAFETGVEKRYDGEAAREHDEGCVGTIVCTELGRERTMVRRSINGRPMCVWRCLARACRVVGYLQTNEVLDSARRARNFPGIDEVLYFTSDRASRRVPGRVPRLHMSLRC